MIETGLKKVYPDTRDYSLIHSYGAVLPDPKGFPETFSIYDGQEIPDQNNYDRRFTPPIRPMPYGCTGEAQTFTGNLEDGALYRPDDLYDHTPPGTDGVGRDLRASLQATIDRGFLSNGGVVGNNRKAYFNCYGAQGIDDFDVARIALWINQAEKRPVTIGLWWYPEFRNPVNGTVQLPSFNINQGSLHNAIATGWRTKNGIEELEIISWQGMGYGVNGVCWIPRPIYNALMAQPWTAAFTLTKIGANAPVPVGAKAIIDHLIYWFRNLLGL